MISRVYVTQELNSPRLPIDLFVQFRVSFPIDPFILLLLAAFIINIISIALSRRDRVVFGHIRHQNSISLGNQHSDKAGEGEND